MTTVAGKAIWPAGLGAMAPVPDSQPSPDMAAFQKVSPRTFSAGATDHPKRYRGTQSTAFTGSSMNDGSDGLQKAQCRVWIGEPVPLYLEPSRPKGCTDFLGEPKRTAGWS